MIVIRPGCRPIVAALRQAPVGVPIKRDTRDCAWRDGVARRCGARRRGHFARLAGSATARPAAARQHENEERRYRVAMFRTLAGHGGSTVALLLGSVYMLRDRSTSTSSPSRPRWWHLCGLRMRERRPCKGAAVIYAPTGARIERVHKVSGPATAVSVPNRGRTRQVKERWLVCRRDGSGVVALRGGRTLGLARPEDAASRHDSCDWPGQRSRKGTSHGF